MANKSASGVYLVESTITTLSGSSQLLFAENPSRGYLLIENNGNANIGIRLAPPGSTATAATGSSGTITLVPTGSYEPGGGAIPLNAIYIIGTAGQPVTALQTAP